MSTRTLRDIAAAPRYQRLRHPWNRAGYRNNAAVAALHEAIGGPRHGKSHCPYGHPYDETNTVIVYGKRRCLTCKRNRARSFKRRAAQQKKVA